ncbi:MAG: glycoside hydrolase family 140 protein [Chitinophagaceae bacterium]|nr:glycoside hydrolase family 140 protein [Chitinophagaceae bacterium]MCW5925367.1 glycoside hydrolase family 140 protein [Chitinophagaceae bacterium]
MRYRKQYLTLLLLTIAITIQAQFSISDNKRFLLKDGKAFFWLGDTAWELFHRLDKKETDRYLEHRSKQGFTVIQAVVLAEMDGLTVPNREGNIPLTDNNPERPNEKYFEHVDYVIDKAGALGLNIGLLPTWGDKVAKDTWGKGPEVFNVNNAAGYATWLAKRYGNRKNIIWILGGDRNPRGEQDIAIWRAMGNAIMKETNNKAVITFHPQPAAMGSAQWFHNEPWLSFNMFQTGHCRNEDSYNKILAAYNLAPAKPVIDGEPIYEDHPVCFNEKDLGTSSAYDVRRSAYLALFAGAFGHTYGCHDIWQMYSPGIAPTNNPHFYWYDALDLPGATQMKYVRQLMESRSYTDRVPDQSVIRENDYPSSERIQATRGKNYLFIYTAAGRPFTVMPGKISGSSLKGYWYNPRDGSTTEAPAVLNNKENFFQPPSAGYGRDWVLVLDGI